VGEPVVGPAAHSGIRAYRRRGPAGALRARPTITSTTGVVRFRADCGSPRMARSYVDHKTPCAATRHMDRPRPRASFGTSYRGLADVYQRTVSARRVLATDLRDALELAPSNSAPGRSRRGRSPAVPDRGDGARGRARSPHWTSRYRALPAGRSPRSWAHEDGELDGVLDRQWRELKLLGDRSGCPPRWAAPTRSTRNPTSPRPRRRLARAGLGQASGGRPRTPHSRR
jgi:hypothetical protein